MSYILLYSERHGYFESIHNGCIRHADDFHRAANYKYLDVAMYMKEYLSTHCDEDYHIEVFSVEG